MIIVYFLIDFFDELVGIFGFMIEDFEDIILIFGLSVEWSGLQVGFFIILFLVINNLDYWFIFGNVWDGENMLGNFINGGMCSDIIFNFVNNLIFVGIGILNYELSGVIFLINGNIYGGFLDFNFIFGVVKNVYFKIDV